MIKKYDKLSSRGKTAAIEGGSFCENAILQNFLHEVL
jgi:hypothetical protein